MTDLRLKKKLSALDGNALGAQIDEYGHAVLGSLLTIPECRALMKLYDREDAFRSRVVMQRHGFGQGEYKYLSYPLPDLVTELRTGLYPILAGIANDWNERLGMSALFPGEHAAYLDVCHRAGQTRPTPLLLRYCKGDYNHLHQDLYGDHVFPLQATILLSRPGEDFTGGEFALTEQRPRQQSRVDVVPLSVGDCVIFPVRERPVGGKRGFYRANMRHGVSRLHNGARMTLGIIFHDAH